MAAPSSSRTRSHPNTPPTHDTYSIAEAYETKLSSAKNGALFVAGLQKTSHFFGICALTWATVVLLGGFASSLRLLDFYSICALLLLEATRLSATQIFSKLLAKTLFRERRRPEEFGFKDLQYSWASRLDLLGQGISCVLAIAGLAVAVIRLCLSGHQPLGEITDESNTGQSNLTPSLKIFYALVILNSSTAIVSGIFRLIFRHRCSDNSLVCYHDEVYKTAMNVGMLEADNIDTLEFAFKKLVSDDQRNIRPLTIKKHNEDLVKYIYHNPYGVGITWEYLKSGDVSMQVAAANLPGFWVKESRIEKQVALFWALQDRLYGAGKVAEAAANSIGCLSKAWAQQNDQHPFLISDPSKIKAANVVDTLIHLLTQPIRSSLLFQMRALEGCCRSRQVLEHIYSQSKLSRDTLRQELQDIIGGNQETYQQQAQLSTPKKLCWKLQSILRGGNSTRQTTKIYAASMLHKLLCFGGELVGDAKENFKGMVEEHIDPARNMDSREDGKKQYMSSDEQKMLDDLRESLGLPKYADWDKVRIIRHDSTDQPLPAIQPHWFKRMQMSGMASTVHRHCCCRSV